MDRVEYPAALSWMVWLLGCWVVTKDRLQKAIRRKLIPLERGQAIMKRLETLAPALNAFITAKRRTLPAR